MIFLELNILHYYFCSMVKFKGEGVDFVSSYQPINLKCFLLQIERKNFKLI
jgi:hypothetical protein